MLKWLKIKLFADMLVALMIQRCGNYRTKVKQQVIGYRSEVMGDLPGEFPVTANLLPRTSLYCLLLKLFSLTITFILDNISSNCCPLRILPGNRG